MGSPPPGEVHPQSGLCSGCDEFAGTVLMSPCRGTTKGAEACKVAESERVLPCGESPAGMQGDVW